MSQIHAIEDAIKANLPQIELPERHLFGTGYYVREMALPAGTVATGKMHRDKTMNILISGTLRVVAETLGQEPKEYEEITGPAMFWSNSLTKKAVFTVTDCVLVNIHPTELTDLDAIEEQFIVPEHEVLEMTALLEADA